ncbi:hypothetical protein SAMN05443575_4229 [Jatrophihabitans endophyticus]|uniref:Uncharacterized protein n=1 Tax=Jatrophihabitans endophyticus TaxID=1206085 RepID=A0A1M5UKI9_9ACTN|nr:hypothetical protein [Jatrophihabitans endophyticus]SHH63499.1 hypothetical protein SAMN05443575_4229 [Jatrophihabitans endophyticus]
MSWLVWLIVIVAVVVVLTIGFIALQARRRRGGVIVDPTRSRGPGGRG